MEQPHNNILLANYSLEKAEKAINEGYKNIDISLTIAQNRAYYAVFFAVTALGYLDGLIKNMYMRIRFLIPILTKFIAGLLEIESFLITA